MLTDTRQVEHEGLFKLKFDFLFRFLANLLNNRILITGHKRTAKVVIPVRGPVNRRIFAGNQRLRLATGKSSPIGAVIRF